MKFSTFAVFLSAFLCLANPHQAWAQVACGGGSMGVCGADLTCTPGGCRDLVNCRNKEDCYSCIPKDAGADADAEAGAAAETCPDDLCVNYRCKCETDLDCGSIGRCTEDKLCARKKESPECGRACLINSECSPEPIETMPNGTGTTYNCTFDEDHPYVGRCCPSIVGEPAQTFSCNVGQTLAENSSELTFASVIAILVMGRIRRRVAVKKRS